jgi:hypothetical protein
MSHGAGAIEELSSYMLNLRQNLMISSNYTIRTMTRSFQLHSRATALRQHFCGRPH